MCEIRFASTGIISGNSFFGMLEIHWFAFFLTGRIRVCWYSLVDITSYPLPK